MKLSIYNVDFKYKVESLFNIRKEFQEDSFPTKSCHMLISLVWIERNFE